MGAPEDDEAPSRRGLLLLVLVAAVAGTATGLVGGAFRWLLDRAAEIRTQILEWAHDTPWGWVAPILLTALAAATAAAITRLSPRSAGSGIQDAEAVARGQMEPPPASVIPARFVGGALAIGSGMVLGREGPTVHMGAALGAAAGRAAGLGAEDVRVAHTTLSGAGLAVAFNAPMGGALFVIEELTRKVQVRTMLATLAAVATAIVSARFLLGDAPDFDVAQVGRTPVHALPLFAVFGALVGLIGALYISTVVGLVTASARLGRIPPTVRAATVGALVGVALFLDPLAAGGGDALTQLILSGTTIALPVLVAYLAIRFLLGSLSYATAVPGGLFAPLLALGALCGAAFEQVTSLLSLDAGPDAARTFALVGMAAFFAAVVRAPFTGIVLIIEMTAISSVALPMVVAVGAAALATTLLRSRPVYDRLREILLRSNR